MKIKLRENALTGFRFPYDDRCARGIQVKYTWARNRTGLDAECTFGFLRIVNVQSRREPTPSKIVYIRQKEVKNIKKNSTRLFKLERRTDRLGARNPTMDLFY